MDMLIIVLNKTELLNDIMETLLDAGVRGATVIESSGMGRTLCAKVPIFGGIRHLFDDCRPNNHTIFSVINDEIILRRAINDVKAVIGDIDEPGSGFLFVVPVKDAEGFAPELSGVEQ